jgi:hypothetical protein
VSNILRTVVCVVGAPSLRTVGSAPEVAFLFPARAVALPKPHHPDDVGVVRGQIPGKSQWRKATGRPPAHEVSSNDDVCVGHSAEDAKPHEANLPPRLSWDVVSAHEETRLGRWFHG